VNPYAVQSAAAPVSSRASSTRWELPDITSYRPNTVPLKTQAPSPAPSPRPRDDGRTVNSAYTAAGIRDSYTYNPFSTLTLPSFAPFATGAGITFETATGAGITLETGGGITFETRRVIMPDETDEPPSDDSEDDDSIFGPRQRLNTHLAKHRSL